MSTELKETIRAELAERLGPFVESLKKRDAEEKKYGGVLGDTQKKMKELSEKVTEIADLKGRVDAAEARLNSPEFQGNQVDDKKVDLVDSDEYREVFVKGMRYGRENFTAAEAKLVSDVEQKVLTTNVNTTAGYLVTPPEYIREILKPIDEMSNIRGIARVRTTSTNELQQPRRSATFSAAKVAESGTRSETTGLTIALERIPVHEWHARVDLSRQMLQDAAFDMEAVLAEEFSTQFLVAEGSDFTTGNAIGGAEGFMTNASVSSVNSGNATTIDSIDAFISCMSSVKSGYWPRAVWVARRASIGTLRTLKDGSGQYLWEPSSQVANPDMFLGHRMVEVPDMPAIAANAYPFAFGDFYTAYTIADRIGLDIMRDPYSSKSSGAVEFTAYKRWGGQVVQSEAIYKLKCSE